MGDALVAGLVKDVLNKLTSELFKEFGLLWGFRKDILSLKKEFTNVQALLEDAEEKRSKAKAVELWLKSLRSACLEAENVLDDISTEALLRRLRKEIGVKDNKVRALFSKVKFRVKTAHKVFAIRRNIDSITSKGSVLRLTRSAIGHDDVDVVSEMPDRETSSLIHDSSVIFGRDKEMEMVTSTICNKDIGKQENGEIRVFGIWGMGGLGKTTLAQLVYNHDRVKQYFELKCWVYVSEKFQVKEIMQKIIESIDNHGCTLTLLDKLQESLQIKLNGKKFLIVLDDVWIDEDENEKTRWEELRKTLSNGVEESIVVMTTRNQTTCQMFAKVPELQHKLGCLSQDKAWLLFKKLAFPQRRADDDISGLERIGMEIVLKCKGLPLAVKTMGSLMCSKSSISDWQHVENNNIWELDEINVLPAILKLSYHNLVLHVKRCFAYCCLFPKGYEMEKDELIWLWVSNGFIPQKEGKDLYKLGEEIFNCLVWRSFFILKVGENKGDKYIMHDLMHDMAQDVMGDDCLVIEREGMEVKIPYEVLHLSSSCPDILSPNHDLGNLKSLRSICMFRRINECHISEICNLVYLRVLYLYSIEVSTLPDSIFKLKYLKYLNLSSSSIEVLSESIMYLQNLQYLNLSKSNIEFLPESISYLQKLQALLLYECKNLYELPVGLRYLKNLQHLDITKCSLISRLPSGIKELSTSLRILSTFPIGKEGGANVSELGDLNLLEGDLEIEGVENVRGLSEAKSANIKGKINLSGLTLCWKWSGECTESEGESTFSNDDEVLEVLEPNPCIKKLRIYYYKGKNISPSWMVYLSNLIEIRYNYCGKCEHLPALGRLPNLRVIDLYGMDSLKSFHDEDINMSGDTTNMFPCVDEIRIEYCKNLVSMPSNFPKLKLLILSRCDRLLSLPDKTFQNLNKLEIDHCEHLRERYTGVDWPKISHIPSIRLDEKHYNERERERELQRELERQVMMILTKCISAEDEDEDEDGDGNGDEDWKWRLRWGWI